MGTFTQKNSAPVANVNYCLRAPRFAASVGLIPEIKIKKQLGHDVDLSLKLMELAFRIAGRGRPESLPDLLELSFTTVCCLIRTHSSQSKPPWV